MEELDARGWHVQQANRINNLTDLETAQIKQMTTISLALGETRKTVCRLRWEVGSQLNKTYGYSDGNGGKDREGTIPATHAAELAEIYDTTYGSLSSWRKFNNKARSEEAREKVIERYGNWSSIKSQFLPSYPNQENPESDDFGTKPDPKPDAPYSNMSNIPYDIFAGVMDKINLPENDVKNYIRSYLADNLTVAEIVTYIKAQQRIGH